MYNRSNRSNESKRSNESNSSNESSRSNRSNRLSRSKIPFFWKSQQFLKIYFSVNFYLLPEPGFPDQENRGGSFFNCFQRLQIFTNQTTCAWHIFRIAHTASTCNRGCKDVSLLVVPTVRMTLDEFVVHGVMVESSKKKSKQQLTKKRKGFEVYKKCIKMVLKCIKMCYLRQTNI